MLSRSSSVSCASSKILSFIRDSAPWRSIATELAQQSMKSLYVMQGMSIGHGAEVKNRGIAVGISDPLHLTRYGFQCLVPGYPGEFASTSGSRPLKWIEKTVGSVNTLTVGTTPCAHPV